MFSLTARSRIARSSVCCSNALRSRREGQSIFETVAIQIARNSRGTSGNAETSCAFARLSMEPRAATNTTDLTSAESFFILVETVHHGERMTGNMRLAALAASLVLAACSTKDAASDNAARDSAVTPAAAAPANEVTITATDYAFDAPAEIPAGLTNMRLVDNGKELHHATLIRLEEGKTYADLMAGMTAMKPGTPPPGWMIPAGGPNAVGPGSSTALTMVLQPGNYAIVCFIPDAKGVPHVAHGMSKALTVTPNANANMTEPEADITVTMSDYKFEFSQPLTAGKHTLKLVTAPGQPHE